MTLSFHPKVQADFNTAIAYYEAEGGPHLADRLEAELRLLFAAIKAGPARFPFYQQGHVFRRARLKDFPCLVLYRETAGGIRITVLRHKRRHPLHGLDRW